MVFHGGFYLSWKMVLGLSMKAAEALNYIFVINVVQINGTVIEVMPLDKVMELVIPIKKPVNSSPSTLTISVASSSSANSVPPLTPPMPPPAPTTEAPAPTPAPSAPATPVRGNGKRAHE